MTGPDSHLTGSIDPHVHAEPDVWPRLNDVVAVAREARDAGMGGFVLVNHFSETAGQAAIVDRVVDGIEVKGAIKLNRPVGGLNPAAVETVLELGAAKVDMPTQQSTNELAFCGEDPSNGVETVRDGELRAPAHEILDLVADYGGTLATGHLSPDEIETVVDAAFDHGVEDVVVSHPELPSIDLPVERQVGLAERGAMMEYCYVTTTDVLHGHYEIDAPLAPSEILGMAERVGLDSVMLATDFGQPENPSPPQGMGAFVTDAVEYGFDDDEVARMVRENARAVYGFD